MECGDNAVGRNNDLHLPSGQPKNLSEMHRKTEENERTVAVNLVKTSNMVGKETVISGTVSADKDIYSSIACNQQSDLLAII